jgi:hypothetical protein
MVDDNIPLQQFVVSDQRADAQANNIPEPSGHTNTIQTEVALAEPVIAVTAHEKDAIVSAHAPNSPPPQSTAQLEANPLTQKEINATDTRAAVPLTASPVSGPSNNTSEFAGGIDSQAFIMCAKMATGVCLRAKADKDFDACLGRLKQQSACDQFTKFASMVSYGLRDQVDLLQYYKEGQMTLVHVTRMGEAYPGDYYLIGPSGNFFNVTAGSEVKTLDITKDPNYPEIAARFPRVQIWSVVNQLPVAGTSPTGGLRLTFRFALLNGCATCDLAGYANVAYDFSEAGVFQRVTLLSLDSVLPRG